MMRSTESLILSTIRSIAIVRKMPTPTATVMMRR